MKKILNTHLNRKKILITILFVLAIAVTYISVRAIAKKSYMSRIDETMDSICSERFSDAIYVSYPFLWRTASIISSRSSTIEYIASQADYDRNTFSILWKNYQNSDRGDKEYFCLEDYKYFLFSGAYACLSRGGKRYSNEYQNMNKLTSAYYLVNSPNDIVEMDSILHAANKAKVFCYDFFDAFSRFHNDSRDIYKWRHFDSMEYEKKILKLEKLKEQPFNLYDFFFNNPLDKMD